jgi:hypothetical protein
MLLSGKSETAPGRATALPNRPAVCDRPVNCARAVLVLTTAETGTLVGIDSPTNPSSVASWATPAECGRFCHEADPRVADLVMAHVLAAGASP